MNHDSDSRASLVIGGVLYFSASEVARDLGISRQTFWRWRREGKVPAGRRFRGHQLLVTGVEMQQIREYAVRLEPLAGEIESLNSTAVDGHFTIHYWEEPDAIIARPRLISPPGAMLLQFAEFFYSGRTYKEVLEPTIVDLREEYNEALAEGRRWKRKWVRVRGYWSFLNAAGLHSIWSVGKKLVKLWKLVG